MNIEYLEKFERELNTGLRKQAAKSIQLFIGSFKDEDEIRAWVWQYLLNLEKNQHCCIRYELFVNLIYPTLKKGFEVRNYESTLWLGKLAQNIYKTKGVFEELGSLTEMDFYRKCYELDATRSEGKELLRRCILDWLSYCEHEWPVGILYGNDGATVEQCSEIRQEAEFVRSLTVDKNEQAFIVQFLNKLEQYERGLTR
ncbi:hypothetical protein MHO82_12935 [Vibrio sp. Of7-15]|uniref:hypothetical protein n=1 Tax=Vibrio sp. Of7-15 TaxID=2724879 RepID=UPI001EF3BED2|nr:hypothetical protein [Vibrio sp. Of7-15]MCG7497769.1 hypothetical protein [Vibrio sp. Of7-15]